MKNKAREIYNKFIRGKASAEEEEVLLRWMHQHQAHKEMDEGGLLLIKQGTKEVKTAIKRRMRRRRVIRLRAQVAAACFLLLFFSALVYFYNFREPAASFDSAPVLSNWQEDARGVIRLPSGQLIPLDSLKVGSVEKDDNYALFMDDSGAIQLTAIEEGSDAPVEWIDVAINAGGQYNLTLPDGTKVWLNSLSSISFPSRFEGETRKVILEGEGYFEVVKDKKKFIVETPRQVIEVLGTKFNVSAYPEDSMHKTSLLEGSVALSGTNGNAFFIKLASGYEAASLSGGDPVVSRIASAAKTVSWMKGDLVFDDDTIYEVMNKIARRYDLEVEYASLDIQGEFTGRVSSRQSLENMLNTLSKITKLNIERDGRRVVIQDH